MLSATESVSPRAEECSVIFSLSGKYKHVSMFAASDDWGGTCVTARVCKTFPPCPLGHQRRGVIPPPPASDSSLYLTPWTGLAGGWPLLLL